MNNILICGKINGYDENIKDSIIRAGSSYGKIQLYNGKVLNFNQAPDFNIYESEQIPKTSGTKGILIFKNNFKNILDFVNINNFIPVVDTYNTEAVNILKRANIATISCGMSAKDTLSISSLDYSSALVSLQRNIKTLYDNIIEPHDFVVELKKETLPYPLLASCAMLLLSNIDSSNGFSF